MKKSGYTISKIICCTHITLFELHSITLDCVKIKYLYFVYLSPQPDMFNYYQQIKLKPEGFKQYLLSIGFVKCEVIAVPVTKSNGK